MHSQSKPIDIPCPKASKPKEKILAYGPRDSHHFFGSYPNFVHSQIKNLYREEHKPDLILENKPSLILGM